jgi:CRISPR-associated protein Cmr4
MPTAAPTVRGGLLGLHAQTAVHPGSGAALGTVDLPVQRERHTHWPTIAGSSLKGILRDACRTRLATRPDLDSLPRYDDTPEQPAPREGSPRTRADATVELTTLFGPPPAGQGGPAQGTTLRDFAGALSITDARLLAFPVRSLKGVFAWVTCAAVLERLVRDVELAGLPLPPAPFTVESNRAVAAGNCPCLIGPRNLVLEEFEFDRADGDPTPLARWIAEHLLPTTRGYEKTRARFVRQLVVIADDDFTHFARHATEVAARAGLDHETKTIKDGALFYQEFLPTETLLYAVVLASPARARNSTLDAAGVLVGLAALLPSVVQVGGDETTGKGYCATHLDGGVK